ncbi:MAG: VWA domain-containing protein [Myxococcales bacterium]|nr:VWA domain-containing protein [Myxococcales bacterium]MDD9964930.1 VWA domain-containing protein [Myxococcales bacterium]
MASWRGWVACFIVLGGGCIGGTGDAVEPLTGERSGSRSALDGEPGGDRAQRMTAAITPPPATSSVGAASPTSMRAPSAPASAGQVASPVSDSPAAGSPGPAADANTNVSLGGAQDFGVFRSQLAAGIVPRVGDFDAAGFFAEHHTALPPPDCGDRVCLQTMLGVLGNLVNGENCTMLQLGLNSPLAANPDDRPPLNLAIVVDTSGSMQENGKMNFVRQGLNLLIDGMRDEDRLALIRYADEAEVLLPMTDVALNRGTIREAANSLSANGGTNLYDGLREGYAEATSFYDSGRQNRVILLSDGLPTQGVQDPAQITSMSRNFNSQGIGLSTVGLGVNFNVELMRGLAEQGDGNFYFLENSGAVSEVFTEELSYFTVPVAFDLELKLVSGPHYAFRRAFGSSFWKESDDGGTLSVPSVFLAHRESDEDVTEAGGRRGGGSALMIELMPTLAEDSDLNLTESEVAVIDVSFREPGTDEVVRQTVEVTFPHAPWVTPERGEWVSDDIPIIQKSFVMLNILVAFEMASEMHYAGANEMAVGDLNQIIAAVEDYNEEIQDVDMDYDLEMLRDLRDLIETHIPRPEPPPVQVRADPWPCD